MALHQEPLADAIARGDGTVQFEADAGEENGPYDPAAFRLIRGDDEIPGQTMRVDGKAIWVGFGQPIAEGDAIAW